MAFTKLVYFSKSILLWIFVLYVINSQMNYSTVNEDYYLKQPRFNSCEFNTQMTFRRLPKRNWVYNHSPIASYKGPILRGWPPGASRDINDYLPKGQASNYLVKPRNLDPDSTEILVVIRTRVTAYKERNQFRQTWGKLLYELSPVSKIIYVIGKEKEGQKNSGELQKEMEEFGDILQGNFIDTYNNLTLKTLFAHRYITDIKWSTHPQMVLMGDDDIYVNVPRFLSVIEDLNRKCEGPYLMGHLYPNYSPVVDNPESEYSSKWGVPSYMASNKQYPAYVLGFATLMSYKTVECLIEEAYNLPYFHIEDVFTNGFAAFRCGINPQSLPGINPSVFSYSTYDVNKEIASFYHNKDIHIKVLRSINSTDPKLNIP